MNQTGWQDTSERRKTTSAEAQKYLASEMPQERHFEHDVLTIWNKQTKTKPSTKQQF